jgi:hypothetical protein
MGLYGCTGLYFFLLIFVIRVTVMVIIRVTVMVISIIIHGHGDTRARKELDIVNVTRKLTNPVRQLVIAYAV